MAGRYVVVAGCGLLGRNLANHLSRRGDSVVMVDSDPLSLDSLSPEFSGFRLEGDATQPAILRKAKIEKADVFMAAAHDDNVNLLTARMAASIFKVPVVIARVSDPNKAGLFKSFGVVTICPTSVLIEAFVGILDGVPLDGSDSCARNQGGDK